MAKKINPEVKALWVQALRSGEYAKGTGSLYARYLRSGVTQHCALGVLCEEAGKAGVIEIDESQRTNNRFMFTNRCNAEHLVPVEVVEWADLGDFDEVEENVFKKNDRTQMTLAEIADYIEETF